MIEKMANTYAESWEAASQRVQASLEDLYDDLINDDFFINLTDGAAKLIDIFGEILDSMGGLRGLLPLISAGLLQAFGPKILTSLRNF